MAMMYVMSPTLIIGIVDLKALRTTDEKQLSFTSTAVGVSAPSSNQD